METNVRIYCANTATHYDVATGSTLQELSDSACFETAPGFPVLAALVDNKLKSLDYKFFGSHEVRFISYDHPDGRRTYIRSLCFVLQKVVHEMFPDKVLAIDYALPSGLYCELREKTYMEDGRPQVHFVTDSDIDAIRNRMKQIIDADLPFTKTEVPHDEAVALFEGNCQWSKALLLESLGRFNYNVYWLDGLADKFYGPLTPSTGCLTIFDLTGFNEGFILQYPMDGNPGKVLPMKRQSKIATALKEHSDWCAIMGVTGVGTLNHKVLSGGIVDLINLSEALHERKYAEIA
ncbi:MAG: hypothetical protein J6Q12_07200, partial [Bacteroidales bacterium]|nr:hypothetical protein [Bacteroidales bacterium]